MPLQMKPRILLTLAIVVLYVLHQDAWFWRTARPLVFGFLPVGLAYHAAYCLAAALLMWALTTFAWPSDVEELAGRGRTTPDK
jgi:hypothetical protein